MGDWVYGTVRLPNVSRNDHLCHGGPVILGSCEWCIDSLYGQITGRAIPYTYDGWRREWEATTKLYALERMTRYVEQGSGDADVVWATILRPEPEEPRPRARDDLVLRSIVFQAVIQGVMIQAFLFVFHIIPYLNIAMLAAFAVLFCWRKHVLGK